MIARRLVPSFRLDPHDDGGVYMFRAGLPVEMWYPSFSMKVSKFQLEDWPYYILANRSTLFQISSQS